MEDNEKLVEETENVEELTTEEIEDVETEEQIPVETEEKPVETFTKEQVDEMLAKKIARKEAKLRREYANKYGRLESVVNAGLGTNSTEEAVEKLTNFYTQKGINIPKESGYTEHDLDILAESDADEIIQGGYNDIVEEVDRLAAIGLDNMSDREKMVFNKLAVERQRIEQVKELASIGVNESELDSEEFKKYAEKLNPNLSLKEKYEMYQSQLEKKQTKTIGSMKGVVDNRKDYYSPEEISKLTEEDLDDPAVWDAVRKSMTHQN